jgi:hypothetical protein
MLRPGRSGAHAMEQQAEQPATPPAAAAPSPKGETFVERLKRWDAQFAVFKGLGLVTVIASLGGGYLQYLSSYEQKVGELAQSDLTAATAAFVQISNDYAEAQMLQQQIYFDYADVASPNSSAGDKAMTTKAVQASYADYTKARNGLRQNSSIYARKAELYIDWPSDIGRDPATARAIDGDPLNEAKLGDYNFDCDAADNLPHYADKKNGADSAEKNMSHYCDAPNQTRQIQLGSDTIFCAYDTDKKRVDNSQPALTLHWQSAKHHLLVMHYCFELAHRQLATARIWASGNDVGDAASADFVKAEATYQNSLDREVIRLDAFLNLVMSELERIRVKYRPSGPFCHVPLVREAIGLFSKACTPIRTAEGGQD